MEATRSRSKPKSAAQQNFLSFSKALTAPQENTCTRRDMLDEPPSTSEKTFPHQSPRPPQQGGQRRESIHHTPTQCNRHPVNFVQYSILPYNFETELPDSAGEVRRKVAPGLHPNFILRRDRNIHVPNRLQFPKYAK